MPGEVFRTVQKNSSRKWYCEKNAADPARAFCGAPEKEEEYGTDANDAEEIGEAEVEIASVTMPHRHHRFWVSYVEEAYKVCLNGANKKSSMAETSLKAARGLLSRAVCALEGAAAPKVWSPGRVAVEESAPVWVPRLKAIAECDHLDEMLKHLRKIVFGGVRSGGAPLPLKDRHEQHLKIEQYRQQRQRLRHGIPQHQLPQHRHKRHRNKHQSLRSTTGTMEEDALIDDASAEYPELLQQSSWPQHPAYSEQMNSAQKPPYPQEQAHAQTSGLAMMEAFLQHQRQQQQQQQQQHFGWLHGKQVYPEVLVDSAQAVASTHATQQPWQPWQQQHQVLQQQTQSLYFPFNALPVPTLKEQGQQSSARTMRQGHLKHFKDQVAKNSSARIRIEMIWPPQPSR